MVVEIGFNLVDDWSHIRVMFVVVCERVTSHYKHIRPRQLVLCW
jgi:hypothetical protein